MNIASIVERARLHFPDKEALVFEDRRYTYGQLDESVNRVANALCKLGVKRGGRPR